MENIDYNLIVKDFQSNLDVIIAELNYAKKEAQNIADLASRDDSKTYENIALIKSKSVLDYCVSANKRLQLAYENAKQVQDCLKQTDN